MKPMFPTLAICCTVLGLTTLAAAAETTPPPRNISVSGQGEVSATPDMAVVSLGVRLEDKTAHTAMTRTSQTLAQVLTALKEKGIPPRDIQTTQLDLSTIQNHGKTGSWKNTQTFVASNQLTIRIRDLEKVGPVLDAALEAGANDFNGIHFAVENPKNLIDEARKLAVKDAMNRAKLYANAASVNLGPLISLSENQIPHDRPVMYGAARMSPQAIPVAEGEVNYSATVHLTYTLTP